MGIRITSNSFITWSLASTEGRATEEGKNNGKPGDPSIDHHGWIQRMLAKILIPSLIRTRIYRALCFFNDRSLLFDQIMYLDNGRKWCVI